MPLRKRPAPRRRFKRKNIYGTKPQFMSRGLARKRNNQISTKVFYFVQSGSIESTVDGRYTETWSPMRYEGIPPAQNIATPNFSQLGDFINVSRIYSEYKMLVMKVQLFAANIGTEGVKGIAGAPQALGFNRGDCILFPVVSRERNQGISSDIQDLITRAGAKMIPSRASKWSRTLYRPKGFPAWGCCDINTPPASRTEDEWHGQLILQGQNASPGSAANPKTLFYWVVRTKVVFRGRRYSPDLELPAPRPV